MERRPRKGKERKGKRNDFIQHPSISRKQVNAATFIRQSPYYIAHRTQYRNPPPEDFSLVQIPILEHHFKLPRHFHCPKVHQLIQPTCYCYRYRYSKHSHIDSYFLFLRHSIISPAIGSNPPFSVRSYSNSTLFLEPCILTGMFRCFQLSFYRRMYLIRTNPEKVYGLASYRFVAALPFLCLPDRTTAHSQLLLFLRLQPTQNVTLKSSHA